MENIIGIKRGYLECLEDLPARMTKSGLCQFVKVKCDCGNIKDIRKSSFLGHNQKNCGRDCRIRNAKYAEAIGQTFGKFTVLSFIQSAKGTRPKMVVAQCECGAKREMWLATLLAGTIQQCRLCAAKQRRSVVKKGTCFDRWVVKETFMGEDGFMQANCLCDCGNEKTIRIHNLTKKKKNKHMVRSCGCARKKDLTGQVFGKLTVIRELPAVERVIKGRKIKKRVWLCSCECGTQEKAVMQNELTAGSTKSCGCLQSAEKRSERVKGKNNPMYGRKGSKHPAWKAKRTHGQRAKERKENRYYLWRKAVYERDNYQCKCCGDESGGNLVAHHVYNYADYPEVRYHIDNGITLCNTCHNGFHSLYGKQFNTGKQLEQYMNVCLNSKGFLTIEEMMSSDNIVRDNAMRIKPYTVEFPNGEKKHFCTYNEIREEADIPISASVKSVLRGMPYVKKKVVALQGGQAVKEFASFHVASKYYKCSGATLKNYVGKPYKGNVIQSLQGISFQECVESFVVKRKNEADLNAYLQNRLAKNL